MATIGFLGLGLMGSAMARRLIDAGHDVAVWNRSPARAEPFAHDATVATTPHGAAAGREVIITMLRDADAVRAVLFGDGGAAGGMAHGATLIEMSTIGVDAVMDIATRVPPGVEVIDAPVLGSVPQAQQGRLRIFVGATDEAFAAHRELLSVLGEPIHVGGRGAGAAMKLVTNSTLGVLMAGLGEALALGRALGLDEKVMFDVLVDSPIGATAASKRDRITTGVYPPNFKLELARKDLELVAAAAERAGLDLKLVRMARAWLSVAEARGYGSLDYSAVVAAIRGTEASAGDQNDE